jgi:mannose-6-phosphate isomerase-like protein (cupin superfamily)
LLIRPRLIISPYRKPHPCNDTARKRNVIIVNRNRARVIATPHGSEIRPLIDRTTSEIERCSLAEEILPPGASVGVHFHRETEEIYYVVDGNGMMLVGDESTDVGPGDAILIPREQPHSLKNTGNRDMRILLVCGPAHSFSDHFAVGER